MKKNNIIMKCCVCQRIKTDHGWDYHFMATSGNEVISHGYCPLCYQDAMDELETVSTRRTLELAR